MGREVGESHFGERKDPTVEERNVSWSGGGGWRGSIFVSRLLAERERRYGGWG
jgi:hypothetical protein